MRIRSLRWVLAVFVPAIAAGALLYLLYFRPTSQTPPRAETTVSLASPSLSVTRPRDPVTGEFRDDDAPREATEDALRDESVRLCERVARELSRCPEAFAIKAAGMEDLGRYVDAEEAWRQCRQLDPRFTAAYLGIARVALDRGENKKAIRNLQQALSLKPDNLMAYGMLVKVLLSENRIEEAISASQEAQRRDPTSPWTHYWAGQAHLQNENYEQARQCYEKSVTIAPEFRKSYHPLAIACRKLGDTESADRYFQMFASLKESQLSDLRETRLKHSDLTTQQDRVASLDFAIGKLWEQQADLAKSEMYWLRARAVSPSHIESRVSLVERLVKQDRLADAVVVAEELIAIQPANSRVRRQTASLLCRFASQLQANHETPQAIAHLERAMQLDPENLDAKKLLDQFADSRH